MLVSNLSGLGMHQGITNGRCISQNVTRTPLNKGSRFEEGIMFRGDTKKGI